MRARFPVCSPSHCFSPCRFRVCVAVCVCVRPSVRGNRRGGLASAAAQQDGGQNSPAATRLPLCTQEEHEGAQRGTREEGRAQLVRVCAVAAVCSALRPFRVFAVPLPAQCEEKSQHAPPPGNALRTSAHTCSLLALGVICIQVLFALPFNPPAQFARPSPDCSFSQQPHYANKHVEPRRQPCAVRGRRS
jgi:hypothetical protein